MPDNLISSIPLTPLTEGVQIVLEALDPDDGTAVSGVSISEVTISGERTADDETAPLTVAPPRLIPGAAG